MLYKAFCFVYHGSRPNNHEHTCENSYKYAIPKSKLMKTTLSTHLQNMYWKTTFTTTIIWLFYLIWARFHQRSTYSFYALVPQSVRTQSSCQYLFTLLGPTSVKAVRRTLMKLTPGCRWSEREVDRFRNGLSDIGWNMSSRLHSHRRSGMALILL